MSTETVRLLVTSAGRRGALIQCARRSGSLLGVEVAVEACDRSSSTAAGHLSDALHLVPSVDDPAYRDTLLDLVVDRSIDCVIPTIDPELPVLAELRPEFEAHIARNPDNAGAAETNGHGDNGAHADDETDAPEEVHA